MPSSLLSRRQLIPLASAGLLALAVLVVPAPGSVSVIGTQWFASIGAGLRNVDLVSEAGLLLLAATAAAVETTGFFAGENPLLEQFPRKFTLNRVMGGNDVVHLAGIFGVGAVMRSRGFEGPLDEH